MDKVERSAESRMTRRGAMGAFAAGMGALAFAPSRVAHADEGSAGLQWVSWDDGFEYPLVGVDEGGEWIVEFDDGEYTVDSSGWIFDDGAWYAISAVDDEGIWYVGTDGFDYAIDDFNATPEFVV